MVRYRVDETIALLRIADLVEIHGGPARIVTSPIGQSRIAAVVDARAVTRPGDAPELCKAQRIGGIHAVLYLAESPDLPIGSAVRERVRDHVALGARREVRQRNRRI